MRNPGFPEDRSPGTFFTPPHQEKEKVGAFPGQRFNTGMSGAV